MATYIKDELSGLVVRVTLGGCAFNGRRTDTQTSLHSLALTFSIKKVIRRKQKHTKFACSCSCRFGPKVSIPCIRYASGHDTLRIRERRSVSSIYLPTSSGAKQCLSGDVMTTVITY